MQFETVTKKIDLAEGEVAAYDVCDNLHVNHVLKSTRVPARVPQDVGATRDRPRVRARLRAAAADVAGMRLRLGMEKLWVVRAAACFIGVR